IAEAARAVLALGEGGIELQQRALEEPQLRRDLALRQHLQRAPDERQRLADRRAGHRWLPAVRTAAAAARQVLVRDELVAVLLHRHAGELASADDDDLASVLFEFFDKRDEIAVASDNDERV